MKTFLLASLFTLSTSAFAAETTVKIIDIETCYKDAPFVASRIENYKTFGTNGYPWYNAFYAHVFQSITKKLVIVTNEFGNIYEKEISVKDNKQQNFESVANYFERETANNYTTQNEIVTANVKRFIEKRAMFQCAG